MSFIPGWFPVGAVAAKTPPASTAFLQVAHDNANANTYTFTSQNIGIADSTRRVAVVFHSNNSNVGMSVVSATIGGISATIHVNAQLGPGGGAVQDFCTSIFSALVPTGTTATIVVNLSAAAVRASIGVYRQINELNSTPTATMTDTSISSNSQLANTINIPAVGMLYAGSIWVGPGGSGMNWSGATEQYDTPHPEAGGVILSGAFGTGMSLETGRTISSTTTVAGSIARGAMAAMSWG